MQTMFEGQVHDPKVFIAALRAMMPWIGNSNQRSAVSQKQKRARALHPGGGQESREAGHEASVKARFVRKES